MRQSSAIYRKNTNEGINRYECVAGRHAGTKAFCRTFRQHWRGDIYRHGYAETSGSGGAFLTVNSPNPKTHGFNQQKTAKARLISQG